MVYTSVVLAYGYDISVTSSTLTVGNSVTLSISVSDAAGKFTISSSDSSIVSVSTGSLWVDNAVGTVTLRANKAGTAKITVTPTDVTSYSEDSVTGAKTITITVRDAVRNTPAYTPPVVKSSNNYLSSLSVEGCTINEPFDKELLEYSVTVPAGTERIKIKAQLADSEATVIGAGEVIVTEGLNTINLVVTAPNGGKRTYVLKATVEELTPINVTVGADKYTVVRKAVDLPEISEYYEETTVKIGEETVAGYVNEKLKYTLVGLKDSRLLYI